MRNKIRFITAMLFITFVASVCINIVSVILGVNFPYVLGYLIVPLITICACVIVMLITPIIYFILYR